MIESYCYFILHSEPQDSPPAKLEQEQIPVQISCVLTQTKRHRFPASFFHEAPEHALRAMMSRNLLQNIRTRQIPLRERGFESIHEAFVI